MKVTVVQDGGVSFNPITDDMLRTFHTKPQVDLLNLNWIKNFNTNNFINKVTVLINDIMSKCSNSCDFEWSESATPIVTAIDASKLF